RFRNPERQREEPYYRAAFEELRRRKLIDLIVGLPPGLTLEGASDCAWDRTRRLFWMGYGPRSCLTSASLVADVFGTEVVALELQDGRFYHVDTALCTLTGGEVMYVPHAFSTSARNAIRERVNGDLQIEIGGEDSLSLAANAVCLGKTIV